MQDQLNGNFNWNHYEIEGQAMPVPQLVDYYFLRDNDYDGLFETIISNTASNAITDPSYVAFQNIADWRIETNWSIL
ncbi:MAG: hypothetical protein IPG89_19260 [Bacteroidetes bacterium]|nr:hypothetical protein [Bacteroidota bacterium]